MKDDIKRATKNLRNRTTRLEREGDYWSDNEREQLTELFVEGVGISEMAIELQRTEPAVFQQIEKMDLYGRKDHPKRRKYKPRCGCLCSNCRDDYESCPKRIQVAKEESGKEGQDV